MIFKFHINNNCECMHEIQLYRTLKKIKEMHKRCIEFFQRKKPEKKTKK